MGERAHKRRRVFIEDVRGGGSYLRATWHPERRLFTISTWNGEVCTGAVRLPAHRAPELVSLVVDGLAEPPVAPPADAAAGAGAVAGQAGRPRPAPPAGWPSWLPPVLRPGGPPRPSPLDGVRRWWADRSAVVAPPVPLRPPPPAPRLPADAPGPAAAGQAVPPPGTRAGVAPPPPPPPAAPAPPAGGAQPRWADVTPVPVTPPAEGQQTG